MQSDLDLDQSRVPFIRLLGQAFGEFTQQLSQRVTAAGFQDLRPGHGCVFGTIDPEHGSRLTDLAERAQMTKQTVGEVVTDLEHRGYVERVPDPNDGRAKIVRLTPYGQEAFFVARRLIDELEREWAERYGEERITALRDALETVTSQRPAAVPVV